jgi:type II secretory pathway pseudopilin PulG
MTLIEVMAVMGASAALMAAAIGVLLAMGRADRQFTRRSEDARQIATLFDRLRQDLHAADAVRWDEAAQTLELLAEDGGVTEYRLAPDRLERWRVAAEDAAADEKSPRSGKLTSAYPLPTGTHLTAEPASAAAGELVRITLPREQEEPRPDRQPPPAAELVAAVGSNARLLHE